MSNLLTEKEVNYESVQSIKNLARLSPHQFEKKIHLDVIRWKWANSVRGLGIINLAS